MVLVQSAGASAAIAIDENVAPLLNLKSPHDTQHLQSELPIPNG